MTQHGKPATIDLSPLGWLRDELQGWDRSIQIAESVHVVAAHAVLSEIHETADEIDREAAILGEGEASALIRVHETLSQRAASAARSVRIVDPEQASWVVPVKSGTVPDGMPSGTRVARCGICGRAIYADSEERAAAWENHDRECRELSREARSESS